MFPRARMMPVPMLMRSWALDVPAFHFTLLTRSGKWSSSLVFSATCSVPNRSVLKVFKAVSENVLFTGGTCRVITPVLGLVRRSPTKQMVPQKLWLSEGLLMMHFADFWCTPKVKKTLAVLACTKTEHFT